MFCRNHTAWPLLAAALVALSMLGCSSEAKLKGHLKRADTFFQAGRYEEAEIEYQNARLLTPRNAHVLGQLGFIYSDQGRISLAHVFLTEALNQESNNLPVRLRLAFLRLASGERETARMEALAILKMQPTSAEAQLLLAQSLQTPEEADAVLDLLNRLVQQNGKSASLHLALATVHFQSGKLDKAEVEINQALVLDPEYSDAHHALGNVHRKRGNLRNAGLSLKRAAELSPPRSARRLKYVDFIIQQGDLPAAKIMLKAMNRETRDYLSAYLRRAELALAEKDYSECDSLVATLLLKDPSNFDALLLGGRVRLFKNESVKAIEQFERLTALYPQSPQAHHYAGLAYLQNYEPLKATASFQKAVALEPGFSEARYQLAAVQLQKGEAAAAIDTLRQFTNRDPKNPQGDLLLAAAYRVQGRWKDSLKIYQQAEATLPQNPEIPVLRGLLLLEHREVNKAREAFNKALTISKTFFPALEQIVRLDIAEHRFDEATKRVEKELKVNEASPQLHYIFAKILLAQRSMTQAETSLKKALALDPNFGPARISLARLYAELRKDDQALSELNMLLAKNLRDADAMTLKAMIEMRQNKITAARETLKSLLVVNPQSVPVLNNLAYIYSAQPKLLDKAYALARKAQQLAPRNPQIADTLGWIQCKRGDYEAALPNLRNSATAFPEKPEMQLHLGYAHYMLCEHAPARAALERASTGADPTIKSEASKLLEILHLPTDLSSARGLSRIEQRLRDEPKDPVALAKLAAFHELKGNVALAEDTWKQAMNHIPRSAFIITNLSRLYLRIDQTNKALELSKQVHKLLPENAELSHHFGRIAYDSGDHQWAVTLLEAAANRTRNNPEMACDLAFSYFSVGRVKEAEKAVRVALNAEGPFQRGKEAQLFLEMCEVARSPSIDAESIAKVESLLKAEPNHAPARIAAATIAVQSGRMRVASEHFLHVLHLYPRFTPAKKRLCILYAQAPQDWSKSFRWAQEARVAYPDDPEIAKVLGINFYQQGDFKRSVQVLKESIRSRVDDPELFYFLGLAQFHLKEAEESRRALQKALSLDAGATFAADARKVLQKMQ